MTDLNPYFAGVLVALYRPVAKAHREIVNRSGHYRRTKAGKLVWVQPHEVLVHIAEQGPEPDLPKTTGQNLWMGRTAMDEAIKGHDVVHAMYRKGIGWIDFLQGTPGDGPPEFEHGGGITHIRAKRDYDHQQDPRMLDGVTTLKKLPEVLATGQVTATRGRGKVEIELEGFRAVLNKFRPDEKNPAEHWLLTGFKKGRPR
jgi:hypothetical protein